MEGDLIMATMATRPVVARSRHCLAGLAGLARLLALVALTAGAAGCAAVAHTGIGPVLRIPEAPPRVVTQLPVSPPEPAQTEAPPAATESTDAAGEKPPPERPAPRASASTDATTDIATSPDQDQSADTTQVTRELTSVPDQATNRRTVESTLAATTALLDRLDRSALDAAARAQFDTARRFLEQAETALAADSLVFALSLGQKAQTLAQGL